jgi:hypothetical protein
LIFASVYYGFLIFWVWIGQRLLYPIQPQFQFAFLFGIFSLLALTVSKFKNKKLSTNLPKILLVIFVSSMILLSIVKSYSIKNSRNNIGDMQLRTQWVRENAASDDVILSEEPTTDYLYLQRNIIEFPFHVKSELEFSEYLQTASVDYILVAPEINWQPVAYEPTYSKQLDAILPYINQLATENMITLVHEDVSNLIRVYQVNSIVGQ